MKELFDFQRFGLINDEIFKCSRCDCIMQCFTSEGNTSFCPDCGTRNWGFETYKGDDEDDDESEMPDKDGRYDKSKIASEISKKYGEFVKSKDDRGKRE